MRFVFLRHPEFLLSVSPLLYGYLTVAAGFLIAHVFLSASSFFTSVFAGCFMAGTFLGSLLIGRYADRYGNPFFVGHYSSFRHSQPEPLSSRTIVSPSRCFSASSVYLSVPTNRCRRQSSQNFPLWKIVPSVSRF